MNETAFRHLISGQSRGLAAALARGGLCCLTPFYGAGARLKNAAYRCGLKTVHRAAVPVVSIGNLTTGGTGKTPFAAHVARHYREQGVRVCFVSRGYGAESGGVNDEALVLDQLCPDVPHLQNPDRAAAATVAVDELDMQLVILDDGFQHRRLHRDLDIVLIDAANPWGYGRLLPRGLLREPLSGLRRADVVVITRVNQVPPDSLAAIRKRIARYHAQPPVEVSFPPTRLINAAGETAPIDTLAGRPLALFCGIGNPAAFRAAVENLGLNVAAFCEYPDHHRYTRDDVADIQSWLRESAASEALVTQKDLVKLGETTLGGVPLWALEIGCRIEAGEDILDAALSRAQPAPTIIATE